MKKFIITVIACFLSILAASGAFAWMYWAVEKLSETVHELEGNIAGQQEEQKRIEKFSKLLDSRQDDIQRVKDLFVDRANPVSFIEDMERFAMRTKTTILIDIDSASEGQDFLKFRFTIEGEAGQVRTMLALLEHAPYELFIDSVVVQQTREPEDTVAASDRKVISPKLRMRMIIASRVKTL